MQSQRSTKQSKQDHPRLPWGMGSAVLRGRSWWLSYRTPDGEIRYENSGTEDAAEAQRIMAQRALPRARALVATLKRIANGETHQGDTEAGAGARRQKTGGRAKAAGGNRRRDGKGGTR